MSEAHGLFKVGQLVESTSFQKGFRGAWFRCTILDSAWKNGALCHYLQHIDFPDEKIRWTKLYQVPSSGSKSRRSTREMMLRPAFPPIYRESEMPAIISEAIVVVNGAWKVGDLVDWWSDDCYWSGRICRLLGKDEIEIRLHPPPFGEGNFYKASCNDLRPSLDWSPANGWIVPHHPLGKNDCSSCARLINPTRGDVSCETLSRTVLANSSSTSSVKERGLKRKVNSKREESSSEMIDKCSGKKQSNGSIPKKCVMGDVDKGSEKRLSDSIPKNIIDPETIEAAVLHLEELVSRIKWMKNMLE